MTVEVQYKEGIGVPQDHNEAVTWLSKSSDQGYANAGLILSVLNSESEDDEQDKT